MSANTASSSPVSWDPLDSWDGNDGSWNTFLMRVGTPPQDFKVLPATLGYETWVPNAQGCLSLNSSNPGSCGAERGSLSVNGTASPGFQKNASSTWQNIGIWTINPQLFAMGYGTNADYGNDTITLEDTGNNPLSLDQQVVANLANYQYWLGQFGLQPKADNFSGFNHPIPSYVSDLVTKGAIPSESWGYTAGASYRNNSKASLTLGGYDLNRITNNQLSLAMYADNSRPLMVAMHSISIARSLKGSANALPTPIYSFIDSTFPWIWVPQDSIDVFVNNLGLNYDNNTGLYLVNDTIHANLKQANPTFDFVISQYLADAADKTLTIQLPYSALDLQASYPLYSTPTNYFPIKHAANDSQFAIGRAFLQEAYIITDWTRSNFTIGQASFDNIGTKNLVAINKPVPGEGPVMITSSLQSSSSGLSGGAIAGIVIGVLAFVGLLLAFAYFLFFRRRSRKLDEVAEYRLPEKNELPSDDNEVHEAPNNGVRSELEGGHGNKVEMDAKDAARHEIDTPVVAHGPIAEAEGGLATERGAVELPGDMPKEKRWQ